MNSLLIRFARSSQCLSCQRTARDVGELFELRPYVPLETRHRLDELLGRHASAGAVGDGSSRRNQPDLRQHRGTRLALRGLFGFSERGREKEREKKDRERALHDPL